MEMLLMGAVLSYVRAGGVLPGLRCGDARRARPEKEAVKPVAVTARFFADPPAVPVAAALNRVPIEALLLQIENHVRLEQAAAECFLESPNPTLLHSRTISSLVN